jgi:hypothetical protein
MGFGTNSRICHSERLVFGARNLLLGTASVVPFPLIHRYIRREGRCVIRKLCIFGTHHQFQFDNPMDSYFNTNLRALIEQYTVDTICEEATGLPPKSCVEALADELGIGWKNIDLTVEERNLISDKGDGDQLQDLDLFEHRENTWVARISDSARASGLLICGLCHAFTIAEKVRGLFDVTVHVYDPRRIYDWEGRPTVPAKDRRSGQV